jgi:DNA-binding NarL/FixJ family response regulator
MEKHILIVDDHKAVRRSLRDWLEGVFPQCDFTEAASGEEAIEICRTITPDLILMDISLPKLNGISTTRRILSMIPKVRVVMLTIHEEEPYRIEAMSAGAISFIPKRMMKTELIPTIKKLLNATGRQRDKTAGFDS